MAKELDVLQGETREKTAAIRDRYAKWRVFLQESEGEKSFYCFWPVAGGKPMASLAKSFIDLDISAKPITDQINEFRRFAWRLAQNPSGTLVNLSIKDIEHWAKAQYRTPKTPQMLQMIKGAFPRFVSNPQSIRLLRRVCPHVCFAEATETD